MSGPTARGVRARRGGLREECSSGPARSAIAERQARHARHDDGGARALRYARVPRMRSVLSQPAGRNRLHGARTRIANGRAARLSPQGFQGNRRVLDAAAEADAIDQRIARVEARTGVQVVGAIVGRSDAYPDLVWKAFALGVAVTALSNATEPGTLQKNTIAL